MGRTKYPIHPDFNRYRNINPPLNKAVLPFIQKMLGHLFYMEKSTAQVDVKRLLIPIENDQVIETLLYTPVGISDHAPCLIYYHGGGFVLPAAPHHYLLAKEYAVRANCKVLFVNYRLAPKYPFPAAPEDCYTAYTWLRANAKDLAIDSTRILVAGDSAGGQLATVVCLMARDRGQSMPCGQLLIYPVTGRKMETESMRNFTDTPLCNSKDIKKYHAFYIKEPLHENHEYASPIHADMLEKLPVAYIETAEFDCLRDEGILYAERLIASGVPVELNKTLGTIHGFDIALESKIVRDCVNQRVDFINRTLMKLLKNDIEEDSNDK